MNRPRVRPGRTAALLGVVVLLSSVMSPSVEPASAKPKDGSASIQAKPITAPKNTAPKVVKVPNQANAEGDWVFLQVVATDNEGDALSYSATGLPGGLGIDAVTGLIAGTIAWGTAGTHKVSVRVVDGAAKPLSSTVSFSWKITAANRPPVLTVIGERSVAEGQVVEFVVSATDPDGNALTLVAPSMPSFASFQARPTGTGTVRLAPAYGDLGTYEMTVRASDGKLHAEETFAIVVTRGDNRAPVVMPVADRVQLAEAETVTVGVGATDPDGDELAATLTAEPSVAAFVQLVPTAAGTWDIVIAPGYDDAGTYLVTVTVSDGALASSVGFALEVDNTNRPPKVTAPGDQQAVRLEPFTMMIDASDPDGDPLSFGAIGLPTGLTISSATGTVDGEPSEAGTFDISVTVTDGTAPVVTSFVLTVVEPAVTGQRIDLRLLLIAHVQADQPEGIPPSLAAWISVLDQQGVAYDVRMAEDEFSTQDLFIGDDRALYQGVVVASSDTWWALSPEERAALTSLQTTFGVRQVTAYVWPSSVYGLSPPVSGGTGLPEAALTTEGRAVFPALRGPVPIEPWAWGYVGARPLDGGGFTTLVAEPDGSSLVGIHRPGDGREELVSTVDSNASTIHTQLLVPGMLEWVTRGVHTGYARDYLSLHVDDVLLADDRWDMEAKETPDDGPNPIRMTPEDVTRARRWQSSTGLVLDLVYNGLGATDHGTDDPLTQELLVHEADFRWINHTFTHLNLDDVPKDGIVEELQNNIDWANANGVSIDATEVVTGEHSGLGNPAMPAALEQVGIRWIASDNSRTPTQTIIGSAMTVPRYPTNLYYNVATFEEQLDEYNWIYHGPQCQNTETHTCLDAPATWDSYVDSEASIVLSHVMRGDPRPHYLHQSNLAEDGVFYPVIDEVLRRYDRLFSTALVQPTMADAGRLLRDHRAWGEALRSGAEAYLLGDRIHIRTTGAVLVPLTGTTAGSDYGGARSGWVSVDGEAVVPTLAGSGYGPVVGATVDRVESPSPLVRGPSQLPQSDEPLPLAPATAIEGERS